MMHTYGTGTIEHLECRDGRWRDTCFVALAVRPRGAVAAANSNKKGIGTCQENSSRSNFQRLQISSPDFASVSNMHQLTKHKRNMPQRFRELIMFIVAYLILIH